MACLWDKLSRTDSLSVEEFGLGLVTVNFRCALCWRNQREKDPSTFYLYLVTDSGK